MAVTYTPIATNTLTSATGSVTFSSISGTYTDLYIICSVFAAAGGTAIYVQYNGDTAINYSHTIIYGNGSSAFSERQSNNKYIRVGGRYGLSTTNSTICRINVMNYANTTTNKTLISRGDLASSELESTVGLWRSTAAITSVSIVADGGTFATGSTFTIYGIKAA